MQVDLNGQQLWFDVEGLALVPDGPDMRERPTVSRWARRQVTGASTMRISSASATACRPNTNSASCMPPVRCAESSREC